MTTPGSRSTLLTRLSGQRQEAGRPEAHTHCSNNGAGSGSRAAIPQRLCSASPRKTQLKRRARAPSGGRGGRALRPAVVLVAHVGRVWVVRARRCVQQPLHRQRQQHQAGRQRQQPRVHAQRAAQRRRRRLERVHRRPRPAGGLRAPRARRRRRPRAHATGAPGRMRGGRGPCANPAWREAARSGTLRHKQASKRVHVHKQAAVCGYVVQVHSARLPTRRSPRQCARQRVLAGSLRFALAPSS
jgi:hypothetical protein